jgi:hypothetical protein
MSDIRIGKDFNVLWAVYKRVDGQRLPYDLAGKSLQLFVGNDYGKKEVTGWKAKGNVIEWTFLGKDQKDKGAYQLILVENAGKEGMVTVDTCKAFTLVEHSCEEDVDGGSDIVIETVTLESEVALAPVVKEGVSYDDTEIKEGLAKLQQNKEDKINKVTSLSDESTDVQYPSAKTVYDLIKMLEERIVEQDQFIEDLQNTKIEKENDDYYPKMAVGLADNLAGVDVVDSEINFRRSGGGAISDGVARIESIKGNSVVWNQVLMHYTTASNVIQVQNDGVTYAVVGEVTDIMFQGLGQATRSLIAGHRYYASYEVLAGALAANVNHILIGQNRVQPNQGLLFTADSTASVSPSMRVTPDAMGSKFHFAIHDLTQMFGAGNEPTTIDEFYARIPMGVDLNAYNEGEVIHMNIQSIESVGVNQWGGVLEIGRLDNGEPNTNYIKMAYSPNYIAIIPNCKYYCYTGNIGTAYVYLYVSYYDGEFNFLATTGGLRNKEFIAIPDARYMRFHLYDDESRGFAGYSDICINISDTAINGKYYPYIKKVEDLSIIRKYFPQGMKSAGSAHDEIRYNKQTNKWEKVVRIGEMDMGTLNWTLSSTYPSLFYAGIADVRPSTNNGVAGNILTSKYVTLVRNNIHDYDKSCALDNVYNIFVKDSAYTDAASFKAAMQGVMLYYELAEPIVTELDAEDQFKDLDYQVWNGGTEKAIAEGKSAPLAADITYGFNAIGKIKELESLVAALRAKVGI